MSRLTLGPGSALHRHPHCAPTDHARHYPTLRPARPHAQKNRHCGPVPALPQPSPCSVARATQTAPAPATVPAHAPAPHKLHPPAPHEKPAPAAPAPPHHPACTNANARVHSASRQSGAHIAPRRCALLSPCLFVRALLRPAPRSSRSPPPGTGNMHQRLPYTADVVRWGSWNLEIVDMDGWRFDPTSSSYHKWSQPKRLYVAFCRTKKVSGVHRHDIRMVQIRFSAGKYSGMFDLRISELTKVHKIKKFPL